MREVMGVILLKIWYNECYHSCNFSFLL